MEKSEEKRDRNPPDDRSWDEPEERRTSKLAILSVVLGISSVLFFALTGIPAILMAIVSIYMIRASVGTLKGTAVALAGIAISILSMFVFLMFWRLDAPPIPNDYTVADLRSAPPQCAESFEILKLLIDEDWNLPGSPAVGLTKEDTEVIDKVSEVMKHGTTSEIADILARYATEINRAWVGAEKAREVIRRLNEFPEIADLTEPAIDLKTFRWHNLVRLVRLYQAHGYCLTNQEDIQTFSQCLIELDSVIRKLSLNARLLISRLICHLCLVTNIYTANNTANNPETALETIELLAAHSTPLTPELISLRNGMLFEYLLTKASIANGLDHTLLEKNPLFKRNSALRWFRNSYDVATVPTGQTEEITGDRLSVWPDVCPFKEPSSFDTKRPLPVLYKLYNPIGSKFIQMFRSSFDSLTKNPERAAVLIQDDMFQIVLNKRLGREVSLKARDYGDEYIVDIENKTIFRPGPDGKAGTEDDIELAINPEVLGWSYSTPR